MSFNIFSLWTFILIGRPQDIFPSLAPLRPALIFTVVALISTLLGNNKVSIQELFKLKICKKYTLFYLIMIFGIPLAYHRREAFNYVFFTYITNMLFFYIFLIQVDSIKKMKSIIFIVCISTLFYSAFSLANGSLSEGRYYFGTMYDPNDLAYFLASLFPLSIYYITENEGGLKKILGLLTVGISIAVILLTGSRGGLLGLISIVVFILLTKTGNIKKSFKIGLLITMIIVLSLFSSKLNMERYLSLSNITSDYNVSDEEGRMKIWANGIELTLLNPITGVGVNCFPMAIGYKREAEGLQQIWQVAHNSYIQVVAEVGVIGFMVYISLIFSSLKNFSKMKKIKLLSLEGHQLNTLAGLLQIGFIASLITSFFLSQGYSILFTLFFAFSALLRKFQGTLMNDSTA